MTTALHWFRRDLRLHDNTALYTAAADHDTVAGIFVIDPRWFSVGSGKIGPFQAAFWLESLASLHASAAGRGIPLFVRTDTDPVRAVLAVAREISADVVTLNKDYEPDQISMDLRLAEECEKIGLKLREYKDSVVFEEHEILTGKGAPYTVFSPYKKAFLDRLETRPEAATVRGMPRRPKNPVPGPTGPFPTPADLNFPAVRLDIPAGEKGGIKLLNQFCARAICNYQEQRDFPAAAGTSRLSAHLSAGTVSPRQCFAAAADARTMTNAPGATPAGIEAWIGELIWREFYRMILFCHPHIVREAFDRRYATLDWSGPPHHLQAWQNAQTGYPIIDAALMQMKNTGWMHNRLRMITAMFLTKDLDVHWKNGEAYFMLHLMDYDQASNVGGWQWSASTGTDAAPYFRVMNPTLQAQRFDADGAFVRSFLPALANVPQSFVHEPWRMPDSLQREIGCMIGKEYPRPIVDHLVAKTAAIEKYRRAADSAKR